MDASNYFNHLARAADSVMAQDLTPRAYSDSGLAKSRQTLV